jgi:hypothetical protein
MAGPILMMLLGLLWSALDPCVGSSSHPMWEAQQGEGSQGIDEGSLGAGLR